MTCWDTWLHPVFQFFWAVPHIPRISVVLKISFFLQSILLVITIFKMDEPTHRNASRYVTKFDKSYAK
jgi:hypothetical protein